MFYVHLAALASMACGLMVITEAPCRAEEAAVDPAGAQFLKSCGTCHTVEPGGELRQGPNLANVFGRKPGSLAEYPTYSDALKKAGEGGLVWNEEALDKWIASAGEFVPGSNMFYSQPDPDKRKLIISYLKSLAANGGGAK